MIAVVCPAQKQGNLESTRIQIKLLTGAASTLPYKKFDVSEPRRLSNYVFTSLKKKKGSLIRLERASLSHLQELHILSNPVNKVFVTTVKTMKMFSICCILHWLGYLECFIISISPSFSSCFIYLLCPCQWIQHSLLLLPPPLPLPQ